MAPSGTFGRLEFQLVLLRRMADFQPGRVEEVLRGLGVSRSAMREANKRWQAMVRSPRETRGSSKRYRSVLGPPETTEQRRIGDLSCEAHHWTLPLWPDLRFEVLSVPRDGSAPQEHPAPGGNAVHRGGAVLNAWLVRAPGAAAPVLRTVEDLTPWSCTVDEVARAFAPARPREGSAPTRWQLAFTAPDRQGELHAVVAEFTWGLLQRLPEGPHAP